MKAEEKERLPIQITPFFMQKLGNEPKEYEDAFHFDLESRKIGVADGASESCFVKMWADLLTRFFVKSDLNLFTFKNFPNDLGDVLRSFLPLAQEEWNNRIDWGKLPWNVEEKVERGAFATFLGFEARENYNEEKDSYYWRAIAIGDCCLFQIKNEELTDLFPIQDSAHFGSVPSMLPSKFLPNISDQCKVEGKEGKVEAGEGILLATDAVAKWIIQEHEAGETLWKDLFILKEAEIRSLFEKLIQNKKMKNDDITILILTFKLF